MWYRLCGRTVILFGDWFFLLMCSWNGNLVFSAASWETLLCFAMWIDTMYYVGLLKLMFTLCVLLNGLSVIQASKRSRKTGSVSQYFSFFRFLPWLWQYNCLFNTILLALCLWKKRKLFDTFWKGELELVYLLSDKKFKVRIN